MNTLDARINDLISINTYNKNMLLALFDHLISTDKDFIEANYSSWDDFFTSYFGTNTEDFEKNTAINLSGYEINFIG